MTGDESGGHAFTIWVDADAAPRDVKEIVFRASARLELPVALEKAHAVLLAVHLDFVFHRHSYLSLGSELALQGSKCNSPALR